MTVFKRIARSIRGHDGEDSLRSFYGAAISLSQNGGPRYSESRRDYDIVRTNNTRYMLY